MTVVAPAPNPCDGYILAQQIAAAVGVPVKDIYFRMAVSAGNVKVSTDGLPPNMDSTILGAINSYTHPPDIGAIRGIGDLIDMGMPE